MSDYHDTLMQVYATHLWRIFMERFSIQNSQLLRYFVLFQQISDIILQTLKEC
jgi:hypothetical protein